MINLVIVWVAASKGQLTKAPVSVKYFGLCCSSVNINTLNTNEENITMDIASVRIIFHNSFSFSIDLSRD